MNNQIRKLSWTVLLLMTMGSLLGLWGCGSTSNVQPPMPTLVSIAVTPTNPSIAMGLTQQFTATGTFSDNSTKDITGSVTWSSLTPSVATIIAGGMATCVGTGSTTIKAVSGSVTGSTTLTVSAAPPQATKTQIRIGDAPVDSLVAFEFTIGSPIVATPVGGGAELNITVGTNRLELSHLSGKLEPLAIVGVPPGSYSSADITIVNPELTFINSTGTPVSIQGATQTVTVMFNPLLTIGSSASLLNMDVNVANSLTTDQSGVITGFNFSGSSFLVTTHAIAAENQQEDDSGEIESLTGMFVPIFSNISFGLEAGQSGAELLFTTDSTTVFSGDVTSMATSINHILKVEGVTKADGSLFAKKVEGLEVFQTGSDLEGMITLVTGNPATSLAMIGQDGMGAGMDSSKVGGTFNADVSALAASNYTIDNGNLDFSGLIVPGPSFPFGPTTIHAGQRVEVVSASAMPAIGGMMMCEKVKLEQSALGGTVSNFVSGNAGAATFDLTLPANSALAILSGQTVVHVFQQPGTDNKFGIISNTNVVRVRGLLFWTGTTFNLIARRIVP
jgi:Big-like domain-containing protein